MQWVPTSYVYYCECSFLIQQNMTSCIMCTLSEYKHDQISKLTYNTINYNHKTKKVQKRQVVVENTFLLSDNSTNVSKCWDLKQGSWNKCMYATYICLVT